MTAPARRLPRLDAGVLWRGGLAAAILAALVGGVGLFIARELGVPVLIEDDNGALVNPTTGTVMVIAFVAGLLATATVHLLIATVPQPLRFFGWVGGLVTLLILFVP